jgi:hypothetical protein
MAPGLRRLPLTLVVGLAAVGLPVAAVADDGGPRGDVPHGHHHGHGQADQYPRLSRATPVQRRQARRLWQGSRNVAARFPNYQAALDAGFATNPIDMLGVSPPMFSHVRSRRYERDNRVLDPRRPESLVYWRPRVGDPVLLGFMYRATRPPRFGGPILDWHRHQLPGRRPGRTVMTHVWLTDDLVTAFARCTPVAALERSRPGFRWDRATFVGSRDVMPCRG